MVCGGMTIAGLVPLGGIVMGAVNIPPAPCGRAVDDVEDGPAKELLIRELDDVFVGEPVLLEADFVEELGLFWVLSSEGFTDVLGL